MAKLTLIPVSNLQNEISAIGAINTNSDRIEAALENTLSRDGTAPNEMNTPLDMNNNRIFNLPKALTGTEPIRYQDFQDLIPELKGEKGEKGDPGSTGPQGVQGPAGASAEGANSYPTYASVEAATIDPLVDYIVLNGYAALGDGGQVHAKRVVSEPTHPFKVQSDDGAWFELIPDPYYRPEMIGHFPGDTGKNLYTLVTTLEGVLPDTTLYLADGYWYSDPVLEVSTVKLIGPGANKATKDGTWHKTGQELQIERGVNPRPAAMKVPMHVGDSNPANRFTSGTRSTPLAILNATGTYVSFDGGIDAMGGFRTAHLGGGFLPPGSGRYYAYVPPSARAVRISGFVSFEANSTGLRQVTLYKNGVSPLSVITVNPVGGLPTHVPFDFGVLPCTLGDNFAIQVYQTSGGNLNVIQASMTIETMAMDSAMVPAKRLKIFQGDWTVLEAQYPTWREFVEAMAAYDVFALSHVDWIGAPTLNPWVDMDRGKLVPGVATTDFPNVVDYGYAKLKQLINDIKTINPECMIFGYVSPGVDCTWVSSGGNPCRPAFLGAPGAFEDPLGSGNYYVNDNTWSGSGGGNPNFRQWVNLWMRDEHLPIDGFFLDHITEIFLSPIDRDEVIRICKSYGKKVMCNITAAGAGPVQWAAACPYLSYGDYLCLEGFYRDGGLDTFTATQDTIAETVKLASRGIWLAALCEEPPPLKGNPSNINNGSNYYQSGTSVTVYTNNILGVGVNHTLQIGDKVYLGVGSGPLPSGVYTVTSAASTYFAISSPNSEPISTGWVDVYPKGLSRYAMDNNSVNNLNGVSVFNGFYVPGWCYDYGRTSVDTLGTPAI